MPTWPPYAINRFDMIMMLGNTIEETTRLSTAPRSSGSIRILRGCCRSRGRQGWAAILAVVIAVVTMRGYAASQQTPPTANDPGVDLRAVVIAFEGYNRALIDKDYSGRQISSWDS